MGNKYQPLADKYVLYGAEFSLYSGKVRSYLRKKGIPYVERLSDLKAYKKFIIPRTNVRFIPVVQTPQNIVIQDTTIIIDTLEKKFKDTSVYPSTPKQKLASLLLEVYGDEWLLIPAMHYRWNFPKSNLPFIYHEFGKTIFPKWPKFIQKRVGKKIAAKYQGFVGKLGIYNKTIHSIERSYNHLLNELNSHFKKYKYLFGDYPSIADFGLIGPMYAHLYRDPYPGKIMKDKAPYVAIWVNRMISDKKAEGDFLASDFIPETLNAVLKRMAEEQIPVLLDTAKILNTWRAKNNYKDLPRFLGEHQFTIGGVRAKRVVIPYSLWMWQRPYNYYQSLKDESKQEMQQWLSDIGMLNALNTPILTKLKRIDNYLLIASS